MLSLEGLGQKGCGDRENVPSRGNYKCKSPEVRGSMAEVRNGKSHMAGLQGTGWAGGDER